MHHDLPGVVVRKAILDRAADFVRRFHRTVSFSVAARSMRTGIVRGGGGFTPSKSMNSSMGGRGGQLGAAGKATVILICRPGGLLACTRTSILAYHA